MTRNLGIAAALALALTAPFFIYPVFAMKALCFALFAASLNLLLGYAGLLSFGHAALFGGAAYVAGYAMKAWGMPPELGLLTGALAGGLLGIAFGALASRCRGIYFAMITFALAQMVYFVAVQAPFTGGEDGLQSVPRGHLFGFVDLNQTLTLYYAVLAIFVGSMLALYRITHSPFGLVLRTIRDNEGRAISLGYSPTLYKVLAFALSGAFAGLAGAMKVLVFQIATLTDVYWHTNGEVVLMTVLGGIGTQLGPVVGALIVVTIQSYFAEAGAWVTIIQGAVFVVMVLAFRRGIVGELAQFVPALLEWKRLPQPSRHCWRGNVMANMIDLSIPVRHGEGRLGLEVDFKTPYNYENCGWQGSSFSMFCHYATHVDAPNHFIADGKGIDEVPLGRLLGPAALIALDDFGREAAITGDVLEDRGTHLSFGDIAILRTGWSDRHWGTPAFWTEGPYLDASAADWLVKRGVKAVVYDFSEEYVVRQPGFRGEECVVHHRILGSDIYNIEYVHNLGKITQPRLVILALPIKLVGLDGAPARVLALEGIPFPDEFHVTP